MKIVLVTGGFDPLHSGHIAYFSAARKLGDRLIVGLNSDAWLARKKGRAFMSMSERSEIIKNLAMVDAVVVYDDSDGSSCDAIRIVQGHYPGAHVIFANGGDRTADNIPEMKFDDVEFVFGVGGTDKLNSSSWILEDWTKSRTNRPWGYYRVLHEVGTQTKLKELTVSPGACLSMQQHSQRAEFWFVAQGEATVYTVDSTGKQNENPKKLLCKLRLHEHTLIKVDEWHQLSNETDQALRLIEIQYGTNCIEEDINRRQ